MELIQLFSIFAERVAGARPIDEVEKPTCSRLSLLFVCSTLRCRAEGEQREQQGEHADQEIFESELIWKVEEKPPSPPELLNSFIMSAEVELEEAVCKRDTHNRGHLPGH